MPRPSRKGKERLWRLAARMFIAAILVGAVSLSLALLGDEVRVLPTATTLLVVVTATFGLAVSRRGR